MAQCPQIRYVCILSTQISLHLSFTDQLHSSKFKSTFLIWWKEFHSKLKWNVTLLLWPASNQRHTTKIKNKLCKTPRVVFIKHSSQLPVKKQLHKHLSIYVTVITIIEFHHFQRQAVFIVYSELLANTVILIIVPWTTLDYISIFF